jgi:hypothetical protein
MFAYDYPLLSVFDNFRRIDHGGWAKALWFLFIVFVPVIGVFCYLLARPIDPYDVVVVD